MATFFNSYEKKKAAIRKKRAQEIIRDSDFFDDEIADSKLKENVIDIAKVGTGIIIGGGVGLLSGVTVIAVSAGVAEVVIGGVVTKIAGVVGGAAGLNWGLKSIEKKKLKLKEIKKGTKENG